jgi:PAS domain S-box-containing protein
LNPQVTTHKVQEQKVDEGVTLSKHSILNKFILASMSFGILAALVTLWRDLAVGIFITNSLMNLSLAILLGAIWFARDNLSIAAKSIALFTVFFFVACKNLFLFGPHSVGIIFLGFCCMIAALIFETRWTIIISLVLSLVIPMRAFLHFENIYPVDQDFDALLQTSSIWVSTYSYFLLMSFIATFGIGQLRSELNNNFGLLRQAVHDLGAANKKLKGEIEIKNAYEEELLVSNTKFQGLFDGSRDGVLLLNSHAQIIEANRAAIDMSGYSLEELKSISIFNLVEDSARDEAINRFAKNISGNIEPGLTEIEIIRKDGKIIPVELNSNLIVADEEIMVLTTVRNISYRKSAENEKFNAALAAEERERERFSKDLHDDLGPVFSTLNLYLQTLGNKESDPSKKEILNTLSGIVDSAVKQVREISHNLSPYLLRDAGLIEAMRTHLRKFTVNGIDATLETPQASSSIIPHPVEIVVYRVFLELLNNTVKHAQATKIRISLVHSEKEIIFNFTDNGKGFDPDQQKNAGIGLKNIENRVRAIGGSVKFQKEPIGITVLVKIPL